MILKLQPRAHQKLHRIARQKIACVNGFIHEYKSGNIKAVGARIFKYWPCFNKSIERKTLRVNLKRIKQYNVSNVRG